MEPSSSARPAALARYGRAGADAGARVAAEARRLESALAPFFARCREYGVPAAAGLADRLGAYGGRESELAAWVGEVGRGFQRADARPALGAPALRRLTPAERLAAARWNGEARQLIVLARILRLSIATGGVAALVALLPQLLPQLLALGALTLADVGSLSAASDGPPDAAGLGDALTRALQGFWYESMEHLDPGTFRALSAELDALSLTVAELAGTSQGEPRDAAQAETVVDPLTGALDVTAAAAFPLSALCGARRGAPFRPGAGDAMAGDHSGISYFPGEQVRLELLNGATGDYRVSIAGLDPKKPGAPNNLEAVALTAQGVRDGNHYYEEVRARLLAELARIPPGSTLHLQGHSMGGGMSLLLRDDPEVGRALTAAGVSVGSLITFGAVRPQGPAGRPRDDEDGPFAGAEERHYVNADDSLARNVGAGHAGAPGVIMLDDGRLDEPTDAHSAYDRAESYAGLTPEQLAMPYLVDPATYVAYAPAGAAPPQPGPPAPAPTLVGPPAPDPAPRS